METSFILTIQLGLIGIVLVAGLYLIWKALGRIEDKVDLLMLENKDDIKSFFNIPTAAGGATATATASTPAAGQIGTGIVSSQDIRMNSIFQDNEEQGGEFMIFSAPFQMQDEDPDDPEDEDIDYSDEVDATTGGVVIEDMTDATISHIGYSKTKLKSMSVEKLKELCQERQIPTDGTKTQLIEQLLR